jgi:hypothetical protein
MVCSNDIRPFTGSMVFDAEAGVHHKNIGLWALQNISSVKSLFI